MVAGADLGGAVVGAFGATGTVLGVVVAVLVGPTGGGLAVDRPSPEHAATSRPAVKRAASRSTRRRLPTACRSTRRGYPSPAPRGAAQAGGAACRSWCPPRPADGRLTGAHDIRMKAATPMPGADAWAATVRAWAAHGRASPSASATTSRFGALRPRQQHQGVPDGSLPGRVRGPALKLVTDDHRRGAAAVEVDRLLGAEVLHQPGGLPDRGADAVAGLTPVDGDEQKHAVAPYAGRRPWVASHVPAVVEAAAVGRLDVLGAPALPHGVQGYPAALDQRRTAVDHVGPGREAHPSPALVAQILGDAQP